MKGMVTVNPERERAGEEKVSGKGWDLSQSYILSCDKSCG